MVDRKELQAIETEIIYSSARASGKTAIMKYDIQKLLAEQPNALVLLVGKDGKQIVASDNNTEIKELKQL